MPEHDLSDLSEYHQRIYAHGVMGGDGDDGDDGGDPPDPAASAPQIGDTRPAPPPPAGDAPPAPAGDGGGGNREPTEYERRLREENAEYRRRFQPYEQAFGDHDPEVVQGLAELATLMRDDPDSARAVLAEALGLQLPDGEEDPRQQPMTRAEFEAWQQQAAQQSTETQVIQGLRDEAKQFGIEADTPQYDSLLAILHRNPELSVEDAAKQMFSGLDDYAKKVIEDYRNGKGQTPRPTTQTGAAPSGESEIDDFEKAAAGARAFLGG